MLGEVEYCDIAAYGKEYSEISPWTLVSKDRCYVLETLAKQAVLQDGEIWECGVYRGGTAIILARIAASLNRSLRLFDTFSGMPEVDKEKDWHNQGDFSDVSFEDVRSRIGCAEAMYHVGVIPETFKGLEESKISFAHVDVDIYNSVKACCEFIFPRLCVGGIMVFDDYGFVTCRGAKLAVDEFFARRAVFPLLLPTGQAIVFKSSYRSYR